MLSVLRRKDVGFRIIQDLTIKIYQTFSENIQTIIYFREGIKSLNAEKG